MPKETTKFQFYGKRGRLEKACILSSPGGPCTLRYKDSTLTLKTVKGRKYEIALDGNQLTLISTLIMRNKPVLDKKLLGLLHRILTYLFNVCSK